MIDFAAKGFLTASFRETAPFHSEIFLSSNESEDPDVQQFLNFIDDAYQQLKERFCDRLFTFGMARQFKALNIHLTSLSVPMNDEEFNRFYSICEVLTEVTKKNIPSTQQKPFLPLCSRWPNFIRAFAISSTFLMNALLKSAAVPLQLPGRGSKAIERSTSLS